MNFESPLADTLNGSSSVVGIVCSLDSKSGRDPVTPPPLLVNQNVDNDLRIIKGISGKFWSDELDDDTVVHQSDSKDASVNDDG